MHHQQENAHSHSGQSLSQNSTHFHDLAPPTNLESISTQGPPNVTSDGLFAMPTHPEVVPRSHNSSRTLPTQPIIPHQPASRSHSAVGIETSPNSIQDQYTSGIVSTRKLETVELASSEVKDLFTEYDNLVPFFNWHKIGILANSQCLEGISKTTTNFSRSLTHRNPLIPTTKCPVSCFGPLFRLPPVAIPPI